MAFLTSSKAAAAVMQPRLNTSLLMSHLVTEHLLMEHHLWKDMDPQVSHFTIVCMITFNEDIFNTTIFITLSGYESAFMRLRARVNALEVGHLIVTHFHLNNHM